MDVSNIKPKLFYRAGYKYQLAELITFQTNIKPEENVLADYIELTANGLLTCLPGYAWDGPSGPTYDSKNSLRASLAHDALYQLMRMEKISIGWRTDADILLETILEEDGMWAFRRWYWLRGVQWFAGDAAEPDNRKPILEAP